MAETGILKIKHALHEIRNADGDGSAKSIALGVGVLTILCSAATAAYVYLTNNPQILSGLGIR